MNHFTQRMTGKLHFLLSIGCLCLLFGCSSDGRTNIKTYNLPLHELQDGLAYEYRAVDNEQLPPYYWYYRSLKQEESIYLTGLYYNHEFIPQQFVREEQVDNGMVLQEMFVYETNSEDLQDQVDVTVLQGATFPFEVTDSLGAFVYNVNWYSSKDSMTYNVVRNRRYLGKTAYIYKEKEYPAVRFRVRELIETEQIGFLSIELTGEEIYAQGIGLVYTSKEAVDGSFEQAYALYDRYPMTELEAKFGASLKEE
ncbi:MAG: hypothetical protein AAGI23_21280 [Bacteroidota bacterium]